MRPLPRVIQIQERCSACAMPAIALANRKTYPKSDEDARGHEAAQEHQKMHESRLRLPRDETNPALQKTRQGIDQREQIVEQTGVSRGIAEPHRVASHSANR